MYACKKCPMDESCSFACEYCTKPSVHEETDNKPDTNTPHKDRSKQLMEDLINNKLSLTDLKDSELRYLLSLVQKEMVRRELIPLGLVSARRKSAIRRRNRYNGYMKHKK